MINNITIEGRLTKTPEISTTNAGKSLCRFSIAHDAGFGEAKHTEFYDCVAFNKLAELIVQYFYKGNPIIVQGRISQNKYTDKNGDEKVRYELIVGEISFTGAKKPEEKTEAPKFTAENAPHFEDVTGDDDLPF